MARSLEALALDGTPRVDRVGGPPAGERVAFSFGTLMTNRKQYDEFGASMRAAGFTEADCEYLIIDNSAGNVGDGYKGLNALLTEARGSFVILCHQDLLAIDPRRVLEKRLAELDELDPSWAVAGNAGGRYAGEVFLHITDAVHGEQRMGALPQRVLTLDENFIVTRRDRRVALSGDLSGFHLYGSDICMVAGLLGYASYVIDFHLHHLGVGGVSEAFLACRDTFKTKWSAHLRPREVQTPCTFMFVGGSPVTRTILGPVERSYYRVQKKFARRRIRASMSKGAARPTTS